MIAVAMVRNKITTPTDQVCAKLYDSWYVFRPVCKLMNTNNECPFVRNNQPLCLTVLMAISVCGQ